MSNFFEGSFSTSTVPFSAQYTNDNVVTAADGTSKIQFVSTASSAGAGAGGKRRNQQKNLNSNKRYYFVKHSHFAIESVSPERDKKQ